MIEQFFTSQLLLYYIYHHSTVCEKYAIMYVTNSKILFSDERQMEDEVLKAYTLLSEQWAEQAVVATHTQITCLTDSLTPQHMHSPH